MSYKLDIEICEVYSSQSFDVKFLNRAATDLEKSGNLKKPLKVREFATEFQKSGKSQGMFLSEIHFQPS